MMNAINANHFLQYQKAGQLGKQAANQNNAVADQNYFANYAADTTVEISDEGLNALNKAQNAQSDEEKLSAKAQSFLEGLREKYGDYDFVVSNDLDTSKTVGGTKAYSVILTTEELEKMADDDDYAQKVMGQVGKAVDMLNNISEKDLGEGVQFSQLSVRFDSEGNMKLFAQLEKLSAEQKERLEAAREKRAEEEKAKTSEDEQPELTKIIFKSADVEASDEEDLFSKIFGIDWSKVPDEEAYI